MDTTSKMAISFPCESSELLQPFKEVGQKSCATIVTFRSPKNIYKIMPLMDLTFKKSFGKFLDLLKSKSVLNNIYLPTADHGLLYLHDPTLRILKEKIVCQIFQF